jgi:predicted metal-binding protein
MSYELKTIKVLNYNTDFNFCECCGKKDLKGTYTILNLQTDDIFHFGSTCALKADKYDTLEAFKAAKKEINSMAYSINQSKQFVYYVIRKNKIDISKTDTIVKAYLQWQIEKPNEKRFNFEQYK